MTLEEVRSILEQDKERRRKVNRGLMWGSAGLVTVMALLLGWMVATGREDTTTLITTMGSFVAIIGIGAGLSPQAKGALMEAAEQGDPSLLSHLIEAQALGDAEVNALALPVIRRLLEKVGEDSIPLDSAQQQALLTAIAVNDPTFHLLAVKAMRHIGGKECIPSLEIWAKGKGVGGGKVSREVQNAATHVLPDLSIRLAREIIEAKTQEVEAERQQLLGGPVGQAEGAPKQAEGEEETLSQRG